MTLTRRQAVLALAAAGLGVEFARPADDSESVVAVLQGAGEVVAPPAIDVDEKFVRQSVLGRARVDRKYRRRVSEATAALDTQARREFHRSFTGLDPSERRQVFQSLGVHLSHPDPDGTLSQRIRYYVVNDLLYTLYTHLRGGEALGVENPPGYPGGTDAYQRGPASDG